MSSDRALKTIGDIARDRGVSIHRVEYVVRARGIQPVGRAGIIRLFDHAGVARIASELQRSARRIPELTEEHPQCSAEVGA